MSLFKRVLEDEIHSVFLNLNEFGETGELAGHENIPMVVEDLDLEMPDVSDKRPGISMEGVTVYVSANDAPDEFLTGRKTTFRHEEWFVLSAKCEGGLKTIQLYRERS